LNDKIEAEQGECLNGVFALQSTKGNSRFLDIAIKVDLQKANGKVKEFPLKLFRMS